MLEGHYLVNLKFVLTKNLLYHSNVLFCKCVHAFTCAGISKYIEIMRFYPEQFNMMKAIDEIKVPPEYTTNSICVYYCDIINLN